MLIHIIQVSQVSFVIMIKRRSTPTPIDLIDNNTNEASVPRIEQLFFESIQKALFTQFLWEIRTEKVLLEEVTVS